MAARKKGDHVGCCRKARGAYQEGRNPEHPNDVDIYRTERGGFNPRG